MKLVRIQDLPCPADQAIFARPLLEGDQSNVRIIRLGPNQALPPDRHSASDLMLFVIAGDAELDGPDGSLSFSTGALAFYRGDEELRVRNTGADDLTLLAFLAASS